MRVLLRAFLLLVTATGVLFAGQGIGYVRGSFMTGRTEWAVIGALLAAGGILALWLTLRPRV
ncbi:MAG: hypothetical protein E6J38_12250 [Chloroflexi bacterium]|nr:MAG: hypothetical protein E6J49_12595 [Chloroflexota bacterium]TMB92687.1 MAG: hypothetical protein E6J38_12250 [Chloroflexota bacterium]TMC26059.1 MAG: hypothetical protein E6J27_13725 [Chloroflexota bacterium]TMC55672.1 MAG: hypothetical protein E6J19_12395 [Chloroflexota bacterium]